MLTEPQKRWVEALRSGKYKQGYRKLQEGDKFCCLGVACDIFKEELRLKVCSSGPSTTYDAQVVILPSKVRDHLGLVSSGGWFRKNNGDWISLYNLNDKGTPFEEIANLIESEPERLFVNRAAKTMG